MPPRAVPPLALVLATSTQVLLHAVFVAAEWSVLSPAHVPPARTVPCFAQVKAGTLLHAGFGAAGFLNDTHLFAAGDWHDVSSLGRGAAPPGRSSGAIAAYKGGALLFGGYTNANHNMADTWFWDPDAGWSELTHTLGRAPPGRSYHTMQATSAGVYLFGGTNRSSEAADVAFGDSWLFADGAWHNLELTQPQAPRPRWGHSMACALPSTIDPVHGATADVCTLFGGARLSEDDHFDDTWVLTSTGVPASPFRWQESQPAVSRPSPKPTGRWSFQLASCGEYAHACACMHACVRACAPTGLANLPAGCMWFVRVYLWWRGVPC